LPFRSEFGYATWLKSAEKALNPVVYALQNCVLWLALDVGEIGSLRTAAPEPIASVSYAFYDVALVLGQLTHAIIGYLPLSVH
jgi:hypothetical protein